MRVRGLTMPANVAVLMAAYNADATVREAVDSIRASTVPCDLFVVDDCSPAADVQSGVDEGTVMSGFARSRSHLPVCFSPMRMCATWAISPADR